MRAMSLTPEGAITPYGGVAFLIVSLIAAVAGLSDIGAVATAIAWILSVVALIAAVIFVVLGRRSRLWLRRLARHRLVRGAGRVGRARHKPLGL
jgi:uncharacterized membrane protein YtjA (UPF0391 family)